MSKIFASSYIYRERLSVCSSCEEYTKMLKVCKACGCFMPAKAKIAQIRCPKDKWTEVYGTEDNEPTTFSLFKSEQSKEDRIIQLQRQAAHLKEESEKLQREADRLNGIN